MTELLIIVAPPAGFLEEIGRAYAQGSTLELLAVVARPHGVTPRVGTDG